MVVVVGTRGFLDVVCVVVVLSVVVVVSGGGGGQGQLVMSGLVGPEVQPSQLGRNQSLSFISVLQPPYLSSWPQSPSMKQELPKCVNHSQPARVRHWSWQAEGLLV